MQKTAHLLRTRRAAAPAPDARDRILVAELPRLVDAWIRYCESEGHSPRSNANRRLVMDKLAWWLEQDERIGCGPDELRGFMHYLATAHERGGRWQGARTTPLSKVTRKTYHSHIHVFFAWLVLEEVLSTSPMARVPVPDAQPVPIAPFSDAQISALLAAAKTSAYPRRDTAILTLLLDTGIRASELCDMRWGQVDLLNGRARILAGKGDKERTIYFGRTAARALGEYRKHETDGAPTTFEPLFISDRGIKTGSSLTRSGLLQLIRRLGTHAKVEAVRCSPHTFRHTFAVNFLRAGGQPFALQTLLGHSDLKQTQKYVKFAQADIEEQHRAFSPVDRLRRKR